MLFIPVTFAKGYCGTGGQFPSLQLPLLATPCIEESYTGVQALNKNRVQAQVNKCIRVVMFLLTMVVPSLLVLLIFNAAASGLQHRCRKHSPWPQQGCQLTAGQVAFSTITQNNTLYLMLTLFSETIITINLTSNATFLVNLWVINLNNINVLSVSNFTKLVSGVIGERMY